MKEVLILIICSVFITLFSVNLLIAEKDESKKTALLLIDIQDFYYPDSNFALKDPEKASLNARKILNTFREKKLLVIHVRHNAQSMAEIHEHVRPVKGEKIFSKNYANSFRDTKLLEFLQKNKVTHLVIGGMMTHMCLEAAVRAAADLGFKCTLIADACTTRDLKFGDKTIPAEMVHYSTLASLSRSYARITDTKTFLKVHKDIP